MFRRLGTGVDLRMRRALLCKEIIGCIDFKDVTFTYPSRPGHTVLDKLTFSIQPGKVTAVVGDYGAGKSTLTSLLPRYEPISVLSILNDKS